LAATLKAHIDNTSSGTMTSASVGLVMSSNLVASSAQADMLDARSAVSGVPGKASVGGALRMIPVEEIDYLKSDTKYTLVAWRGDDLQAAEALIRTPLKELLAQLDPELFVQVHRSVVVNLRSIRRVTRADNETAEIELRHRSERLPVSRSFLGQFKEM
jgi:DNA-binding LytR/AlgR family response regulator